MEVLYILFFGGFNLILFSYLTKSIKISHRIMCFVFIIIVLFGVLQVTYLSKYYLHNDFFYNLLLYSMSIIIIHYGVGSMLSAFLDDINHVRNNYMAREYIVPIFNFFRLKLIYLIVFISQIISIVNFSYLKFNLY